MAELADPDDGDIDPEVIDDGGDVSEKELGLKSEILASLAWSLIGIGDELLFTKNESLQSEHMLYTFKVKPVEQYISNSFVTSR